VSLNVVRVGVLTDAGHENQRIMNELSRWAVIPGYRVSAGVSTFAKFIHFESKALIGREVPATAYRRTAA